MNNGDWDRLTRRSFLKGLLGTGIGILTGSFSLQASAVSPITVGLQVELTGGLSTYGYWHLKSARAAAKKINSEGGIAGRKVKLVHEDTETDPATGSRKMRRLVLKRGADVVLGSQHSGVCLASIPVSRRFSVPYFPIGEATQITGNRGHKYVFRTNYSVEAHAQSGYSWVMENLGTNWSVIYANYAMGQSALKEWSSRLQAEGGNLIQSIAVPQGTDDFGPYLQKVNSDKSDLLFIILYGPDALGCVRRAGEMGLNNELEVFGNTGSVEALDVDFPGAEGLWSVTNYPRRLEEIPDELKSFNREFRDKVELRPDGSGPGGKIVDASHFWVPWENLHLIKMAIESSGWREKKDHPRLIKQLEDISLEGSLEHPQGEKYIRQMDHQGFHAQYIQRVEEGVLRIKKRLAPDSGEYEPHSSL